MAKDPGPCTTYTPVWYFEPNTRTCRRFLYGGCEGNGNRFNTTEECTEQCLGYEPNPAPAVTAGAIRKTTIIADNMEIQTTQHFTTTVEPPVEPEGKQNINQICMPSWK